MYKERMSGKVHGEECTRLLPVVVQLPRTRWAISKRMFKHIILNICWEMVLLVLQLLKQSSWTMLLMNVLQRKVLIIWIAGIMQLMLIIKN